MNVVSRFLRLRPVEVTLVAVAVLMFATRIFGPSSLHRFDQPRTATYTADMVLNGKWLLPRDVLGFPATKPPLVNWLAAPIVAAGFWKEWAIKIPTLIGSIATLLLCVWMARSIFSRLFAPDQAADAAALAGIAWLANSAALNSIYSCRPDPLLIAFLTLGWILGTRIIDPAREPSGAENFFFWLCAGLAALTKGPPALLLVLYLPLAARLIHGRWSLLRRTGWQWGLPLAFGMFFAWVIPVALFHPHHFRHGLIENEMSRLAGVGVNGVSHRTWSGPLAVFTGLMDNPVWFIGRFAPWSLLAVGGAVALGPRRWFRHPLAPAFLWLFLVLFFFSLIANKTADYQLPAYPAAAMIAAWFCMGVLPRWQIRPAHVGMAGAVVAMALCVDWVIFSEAATDSVGENMKRFAKDVRVITKNDPLLCVNTGYNPVQFFLHQHQPEKPTALKITGSQWVVMPEQPGRTPVKVSDKVVTGSKKRPPLALYRTEDVRDILEKGMAVPEITETDSTKQREHPKIY